MWDQKENKTRSQAQRENRFWLPEAGAGVEVVKLDERGQRYTLPVIR